MTGVKSTNISSRTSIADELLVNRDGTTSIQRVLDLAIQLAGSGALADELVALRTLASGRGNWKTAVKLLVVTNINLANGLVAGTVVQGVALQAGDRVALFGQAIGGSRGIYAVPAAGAASRTEDADSEAEILNMAFAVDAGDFASTAWVCNTQAPIVVGTTVLTIAKQTDQNAVVQRLVNLGFPDLQTGQEWTRIDHPSLAYVLLDQNAKIVGAIDKRGRHQFAGVRDLPLVAGDGSEATIAPMRGGGLTFEGVDYIRPGEQLVPAKWAGKHVVADASNKVLAVFNNDGSLESVKRTITARILGFIAQRNLLIVFGQSYARGTKGLPPISTAARFASAQSNALSKLAIEWKRI